METLVVQADPKAIEADIKVACYQDAIDICRYVMSTTGDLTSTGARMVLAKLQDRVEEIMDREHHRMVVEQM